MSSTQKHTLGKRALEQVHLGQSFAEYDASLKNKSVFVQTPALMAAASFDNPHCFFVGRRGTGKTTITRFLSENSQNTLLIRPELFSPSNSILGLDKFLDAKQRPFRSLTAAFRRSLQDEVLVAWYERYGYTKSAEPALAAEHEAIRDLDFDLRSVKFIEEITEHLGVGQDAEWLSAIKVPKALGRDMAATGIGAAASRYTVLLDAIDESWDGSELAVIYLAALMHACLDVNSQVPGVRVLVFLRENIFERVRVIDSEFARLETCVVGLDWTREQLLEMVERRLNAPLNTKYPLGGATWDLFFEEGPEARELVFDYCQSRPRDVMTYCGLALDTAQAHKHQQILLSDLRDARRRFSDSRLSDLGDEYQENFPQLGLLLSRFYGLGQRWTLRGIEGFLGRLLLDDQVKHACGEWIYEHSTPELFVRLLYNIGFVGLSTQVRGRQQPVMYRSVGPKDTTPPPVGSTTDINIHPSYWAALDLQDVLVSNFDESLTFGRSGLIVDLPGAVDLESYQDQLTILLDDLKDLPLGKESAARFEDVVGEMLRLCFFRVLANVEAQSRDVDGVIRRDWVASNRGQSGFWEMLRLRYHATQVIFECKNYEELKAADFQQAAYYMTEQAGRVVFIVFRGEVKKHYFEHIKRCAGDDGLVVLLTDKDLQVFLRQARNGKTKEDHLLDRFDQVVRAIS